jgi:hypothetical protein
VCRPGYILKVHVCFAVDAPTHTICVPRAPRINTTARGMQTSKAVVVLLVHTCLGINQQFHALVFPSASSLYQCCFPILITQFHVGFVVDEQAHTLRMRNEGEGFRSLFPFLSSKFKSSIACPVRRTFLLLFHSRLAQPTLTQTRSNE